MFGVCCKSTQMIDTNKVVHTCCDDDINFSYDASKFRPVKRVLPDWRRNASRTKECQGKEPAGNTKYGKRRIVQH